MNTMGWNNLNEGWMRREICSEWRREIDMESTFILNNHAIVSSMRDELSHQMSHSDRLREREKYCALVDIEADNNNNPQSDDSSNTMTHTIDIDRQITVSHRVETFAFHKHSHTD